ncbi:sterile alpha motif domain-containing 9-like [Pelobates cultripes]|uniref:Sterile alpha motif domain-containing 9-like n=1 Tax=Pelobates cultripes TaxID=61616 RepID=A0AAD1W3L5_PELCU|nr:sterile alpha motif domain-containing 9-like [Pelobates cultripes]
MAELMDLPKKVEDWTKDHVKLWAAQSLNIDLNDVEILFKQNVTGEVLQILSKKDLTDMGITHGTAILITHKIKKLITPSQNEKKSINLGSTNKREIAKTKQKIPSKEDVKAKSNDGENESKEPGNLAIKPSKVTCTPYPFDRFNESKCYTQFHFLPPESGTTNYIDPIHEYKEFTNTLNATEEDRKMKFCNEVFRFAAACMNVRTNGTIHFGVRDKPHGQIIGIKIDNTETFVKYIDQMISKYFEIKQVGLAKQCIRSPRFVNILSEQNTHSNLVVIEVDVVPKHAYCKDEIFFTYQQNFNETWKKCKNKSCFKRDGESSKDILANVQNNDADYKEFLSCMKARDDARKMAEETHSRSHIKSQDDGLKLVKLITGNRGTLDNSYYKWYILVANKSHPSQTEHLDFMHEIKWFAVLDFDSESLTNGLCKFYRDKRIANLHFPSHYQNNGNEGPESLKLFQQTSWIFCNGRSDLDTKEYEPLSYRSWQKEKAAEVRKLISFLSQKNILERGKFLVVFLLLSAVDDCADPINETFSTFYQELGGIDDILCICENEHTYQKWKDLQVKLDIEDMEDRCIFNLDIKKVNGTILKLKSMIKSSHLFLPSQGSSTIILQEKDKEVMSCLDILCANECEETELEKNEEEFKKFKTTQEEHFYKGGKATWWNFYFSSKSFTGPFIKRDIHNALKTLIEECQKQTSVKIVTVYHHPGCGGSTSAMHILWELKEKFRCATLKRKTDSFKDIARDVTNLAIHGSSPMEYFPVLLLVDDYEEDENIYVLQNCIRTAIAEKNIQFERPVVTILNCMRSQTPVKSSKADCTSSVALEHKLSPQEQRAFETKLKEIERNHSKPEDFYSFMIMKSNFADSYIRNVVRNLLKGLNSASKEADLISFLALLNKYVKNSTISASMCEEILGITAKQTYWGNESIEDKMGTYCTILIRTEVEEYGRYEGLRIIHPLIASQCIEELKMTYGIQQSKIMLTLLNTHVEGIGKEMFFQNMQSMLVTRHRKEHGDETDTLFSPLIEEIQKDEGNESVETVLKEGSLRFNQYAFIFQALARHYYIREKNFNCASEWADKAKKIAPNNSFVLDTLGQIHKTKLKSMMDECNKRHSLTPSELNSLLDSAVAASEAFNDCQQQTRKTESEREESEWTNSKWYNVYNTAGYLGQIEVCLYTIDILFRLPWFNSKNKLSKNHLIQYLSGKWDISVDKDSTNHKEVYDILTEFRYFLIKIKSHLQMAFDFFNDYFVHLKQKNIHKESADFKIREKVADYFKKYRKTFCDQDLTKLLDSQAVQKSSPSLHSDCRAGIEGYKAHKFPGILEYLTDHGKDRHEIEVIVRAYGYLLENRTDKFVIRDKENFILANIVLRCVYPNSKQICTDPSLKKYLREILDKVDLNHEHLEPYFLALLLFWPHNMHVLDNDSKYLEKYVHAMRKSFRVQYKHMCNAKQAIAHFYLGKGNGLKRLIHKGKIDQRFSDVPNLHSLWQNGDIWKEQATKELLLRVNGRIENNTIYVECGNTERIKVPVRPAYLGQLRSGRSIERVSFFLGFSIDGLVAYDIESM